MKKIKDFTESDRGKDILTVLIVILVGLGSFGLGRLSKNDNSQGLKIEQTNQSANILSASKTAFPEIQNVNTQQKTTAKANSGNYVASSRGSKYYPIGCPAGKNLKEENKIYFNTASEAEKAGYSLSTSCQ